MREIVPCVSCALCAAYRPAGFTATEELRCTRSGDEVSGEDGCTLGEIGEPQQGIVPYDVEINHEMQTACYYE